MDYYIMSGDNIVAKWVNEKLEIMNEKLCPLYLLNRCDFRSWVTNRGLCLNRINARILKETLHLKYINQMGVALRVNAAKITDNYWVKPLDSDLCYKDTRFKDDKFSDLAFKGEFGKFDPNGDYSKARTPELTNTGFNEKCWKRIKGEWWLQKRVSDNERFSEMFASELGEIMGIPTARCIKGKGCIKSKDFTQNASVNYEPAYSFIDENMNYIDVISRLDKLAPHLIPDYIRMLVLDALIDNRCRDTSSFGILRDTTDGHIISFAPLFNHNETLIAAGYPERVDRSGDRLVKKVNALFRYDRSLRKYIPELLEEDLFEVFNRVGIRVRKKLVLPYVLNAYIRIVTGKDMGFFCSLYGELDRSI